MGSDSGRPLTVRESDAIRAVLDTAEFDGARELVAQIAHARVVAGSATWLDLQVPQSVERSSFREGCVPVRAVVGEEGDEVGEVLVWVQDGRLADVEYAWYTDDPPTEFPSADRIRTLGA